MHFKRSLISAVLLLSLSSSYAQDKPSSYQSTSLVEASYTGGSDVKEGLTARGDLDTVMTRVGYKVTNISKPNYQWYVGLEWERWGFGTQAGVPVPNTLNTLELRIGNSWKVSDRWILQADASPGLYSDMEDIDMGDLNAPLSVRAIFLQSRSFQWVAGLSANFKGEIPVVGGIGFQWMPSEDWTLKFGLPETRLTYDISDRFELYGTANLTGNAFRVSEDFGTRMGRPSLDDQDVTYREIRTGLGLGIDITEKMSVGIEGGWVVDRRFDFPDANLLINGDGAAYFRLAITGRY